MAFDASGILYAVGSFTTKGGVSAGGAAYWDGSAWHAMGVTGLTGGTANYIYVSPSTGKVYVSGTFTGADGVGGTSYFAMWDGSAWNSLGGGLSGVYGGSMCEDQAGNLYIVGNFTNAGGIAAADYIAKWDGTNYTALGTGASGPVDGRVVCGPDGQVYITGSFTSVSGQSNTAYIARWNGVEWFGLGTGLNNTASAAKFGPDGNLYVSGTFTKANGITLPDRAAMWTGTTWVPLDVNLPGTSTINAFAWDLSGNMYIGFTTGGTATSATVTVQDFGSATAYPQIIFTGPGSVYQLKNYTTGRAIYFNLTLLAGDIATLNLDPNGITFTSKFRGNLMNTILPGSDLSWSLEPGSNNISSFMYGSTAAASDEYATWKGLYWSLDGAIR